MEPLSRRRALLLGGLGLASAAVGGVGLAARWPGPTLEPRGGRSFVEPEVLRSENGVLDVTLEAAPGRHPVAGRQATTFAYNGSVPGPTLRVRPGDTIRIRLVNELDQATNLHTHGLLVSPEGNGDNVFVHVDPGASFDYEHRLPEDHPPGVFWYHPHVHELVADQLFAGMYGAIIVEDPDDDLPFTRQRVLLVADMTLDDAGNLVQPSQMERMTGREGQLVLVNGQADPLMQARPGDRERWQVVNACSSRFLSLRLDGQHVQVLGRDIGRFATPRDAEEVFLTPGSRAELVVDASEGRSVLETMPVDRGGGMMMGAVGSDEVVRLATFEVSGSPETGPAAIPVQRPLEDLRRARVDGKRELTFAMGMGMGRGGPGGMSFTIDGKSYDGDRVDQDVSFGSVEEWTIFNDSPMDHPFHLHVWPMQLIEVNGEPVREPRWLDVVNLPSQGWVKVRVAFERFRGRTVYHCHILDHEDLGMMGIIRAR